MPQNFSRRIFWSESPVFARFDSEIRALMSSSEAPVSAPELAKQLLPQLSPNVRGQKVRTLRSVRSRIAAFLREQRRFGGVRPVRIEGKKAQCWELVDVPSDGASTRTTTTGFEPPISTRQCASHGVTLP